MLSLYQFLFTPLDEVPRSRRIWLQISWLTLSLTIAIIYGILALQQAFSSEYVVQDDARQHIFWMRRFLDPELFPNNLIANYFQSVAPSGYSAFYWSFAKLGVDPMLLGKLLPIGLGGIAAAYGFGVSMQFLPVPFTGFLSALLIEQVIWTHDDVISATPRAFMPPLFLAFLYYLLQRRLWPCLVTIALEGLFYPQYVFVFAGIVLLQLVHWQNGRFKLSRAHADYKFCAAALGVAVLVLLPFALTTSDYGPTITAAQARALPEFNEGGRSQFFYDDPTLVFWTRGDRSGIFSNFSPATLSIGFFLPLLLLLRRYFPLAQQITRHIRILPQIVVVSLTLFFVAHAVLFKLHLPSRYTAYTLRFVLAFATALTFTLVFDAVLQWLKHQTRKRSRQRSGQPSGQPSSLLWQQFIAWSLAGVTVAALLVYPSTTSDLPKTNYLTGQAPGLYQFIAQQPKDTLVAGMTKEINDLPSLAQRSILVGREYAIPYHLGYANRFRQQMTDLIRAHYTLDPSELANFTRTYGVDFWLLNRKTFDLEELEDSWLQQYPEAATEAKRNLEQGKPALQRAIKQCTAFKERSLRVLDANCAIGQL